LFLSKAAPVLADRRGAVAILFGLLAPLVILAVAFGIDVTAWYRDALHLQGLADRVAASAGPLWRDGDRAGAAAVVTALVGADAMDVRIERLGSATGGRWAGDKAALEVAISCNQAHFLAGMFDASRQSARAVARDSVLVE
jgi:uncharacterized membrane protein